MRARRVAKASQNVELGLDLLVQSFNLLASPRKQSRPEPEDIERTLILVEETVEPDLYRQPNCLCVVLRHAIRQIPIRPNGGPETEEVDVLEKPEAIDHISFDVTGAGSVGSSFVQVSLWSLLKPPGRRSFRSRQPRSRRRGTP